MRVRKENNALLPNLNQAIKAIKTSGKLKGILDNHGIESSIN
jgi:ABC-type amino acid transport substrate-binding protein